MIFPARAALLSSVFNNSKAKAGISKIGLQDKEPGLCKEESLRWTWLVTSLYKPHDTAGTSGTVFPYLRQHAYGMESHCFLCPGGCFSGANFLLSFFLQAGSVF